MAIRFESPNDINYLKRMIDSGQVPEDVIDTMGRTGGYVAAQPPQQQRQRMRVVGVGGGQVTDLGEEDARALPLDYTRPGIDIPGIGKGQYSRDGRYAVVNGPDGPTKVVLGYDAEGSRRATAQNLAMEKMRADLEGQREQTGLLRDKRAMLAAGPGRMSDAPQGFGGMTGVPQVVLDKQFGKAPEGKRWTASGQLEQIPGFQKPMTESQAKALGFGTRAAESSSILETVGQAGKVQPNLFKRAVEAVPIVGDSLGSVVNVLPSVLGGPDAPQQQVEQAQRNFINAILRRESGAVISPGEFQNAALQYFPQPGDTPEVIAQKKRNRELTIGALREEVGPRGGMIDAAGASGREFGERTSGGGPAKAAPPVGTIKGNHVFTGGDPSQRSSWKEVR